MPSSTERTRRVTARTWKRVARHAAPIAAIAGAVALMGPPAAFASGPGHAGHPRDGGHDHGDPPAVRSLTIVAQDSATSPLDDDHPRFSLSLHGGQDVAAGLVRITLVNRSQMMEHQATLARLHRGVTLRQFVETAREHGDNAALALTDLAGGPDTVAPGGRQTTWQTLTAGRYVVVCLVTGPDGKSHLDLGMISDFRVTGRAGGPRRPHGHVQGTITARTEGSTMTFTLPRDFTGRGLYRFRNAGPEDIHELAIVRLAPGKTRQDVIDWFTHPGPPPFEGAGGFSATMPGHGGWLRLHLKPGSYVATCFVPDDEPPHLPHGALGMDVAFTIR